MLLRTLGSCEVPVTDFSVHCRSKSFIGLVSSLLSAEDDELAMTAGKWTETKAADWSANELLSSKVMAYVSHLMIVPLTLSSMLPYATVLDHTSAVPEELVHVPWAPKGFVVPPTLKSRAALAVTLLMILADILNSQLQGDSIYERHEGTDC